MNNMSLSIYECDTCKRTIEKTQNKKGLDVIGHCIITDGCKGILRLQEVKKTSNNPSIPLPKAGVKDWVQRRILYNHQQKVPEKTWIIKHNLNCFPSIQTFIHDESDTLTETKEFSVNYTSPFELSVTFTIAQVGEIQCISRSAKPIITESVVTFNKTVQLTKDGIITIATRVTTPDPSICLAFTSPRKTEFIYKDFPMLQGGTNAGPWSPNTGSKVLIEGRRYNLYYVDVSSWLTTLEQGSYGIVGASAPGDTLTTYNSKDTFLLLTNSPFESTDKNFDQYIITERMSLATAGSSLVVSGIEISADVGLLKSTFPSIRIVTQ